MTEQIRVFLCDDVPELRTLLRFALEEDSDVRVVGEAGDAATGHGNAEFSLRHAKYLPVPPGGFSIGPGTNNRIIGRRKNFCPRLNPS